MNWRKNENKKTNELTTLLTWCLQVKISTVCNLIWNDRYKLGDYKFIATSLPLTLRDDFDENFIVVICWSDIPGLLRLGHKNFVYPASFF